MYYDDVAESMNSGYVEYTMKNPEVYYEVGMKVLENKQSSIGILSGTKTIQNGLIHITFRVSAYKSLSEYKATADYGAWDDILYKILGIISKIKENGFLKAENLEISSDKIFINIYDNSVKMICIPLYKLKKNIDFDDLWKKLHDMIIECTSNLKNEDTNRLLIQINNYFGKNENTDLLDESKDIPKEAAVMPEETENDSILKRFFHKKEKKFKENTAEDMKRRVENRIFLRALNGGSDIEIDKQKFYIGSDPNMGVDAQLPDNPRISELHCKLIIDGKRLYISDCGSAYGTYVNEMKIEANKIVEFHRNDIISIADMKFEVE